MAHTLTGTERTATRDQLMALISRKDRMPVDWTYQGPLRTIAKEIEPLSDLLSQNPDHLPTTVCVHCAHSRLVEDMTGRVVDSAGGTREPVCAWCDAIHPDTLA